MSLSSTCWNRSSWIKLSDRLQPAINRRKEIRGDETGDETCKILYPDLGVGNDAALMLVKLVIFARTTLVQGSRLTSNARLQASCKLEYWWSVNMGYGSLP